MLNSDVIATTEDLILYYDKSCKNYPMELDPDGSDDNSQKPYYLFDHISGRKIYNDPEDTNSGCKRLNKFKFRTK